MADARFVVVWTDSGQISDGSGAGIKGQIFNTDGTKGDAEFLVAAATDSIQYDPIVTALADGSFVVTWTDVSAISASEIKGQVFGPTGTKAGAAFVANIANPNHQNEATITALADGRFVVAWTNDSPTNSDALGYNVEAQIFNPDGSKASAELFVNTTTAEKQHTPTIAGLAHGGFVVTWTDESGQNWDIKAQLFNAAGGKVGGEFLVNTTTAEAQASSVVAALPDGRFVVAWNDWSGSLDDSDGCAVRGQVFNADGSEAGAEFLVNTTAHADQFEPTITALADGRFVVGWRDWSGSNDDPASSAVRGQMFDARTAAVTLNGTLAADQYFGTLFGDTLRGSLGDDTLRGDAGDDTLRGDAGDDTLRGDAGDDILFGGLGQDRLFGGGENDKLSGNEGSDQLLGEDGNDILFGGAANDLLKGGSGADQLYGEADNDRLFGEDGNDRLEGGEGHDLLAGGLGRDVLTGGTGQDAFVFDTKPHKSTNVDTITDFSHADDTIRLENAIFTKLGAAGGLKSGALSNWNPADQADDRIIYRHVDSSDAGTKKDVILLYYDATGGSTADAVLFAKLTGQASMILKASDFLIV